MTQLTTSWHVAGFVALMAEVRACGVVPLSSAADLSLLPDVRGWMARMVRHAGCKLVVPGQPDAPSAGRWGGVMTSNLPTAPTRFLCMFHDRTLRVKIIDACGMTCTFCHNEGTPVVSDNLGPTADDSPAGGPGGCRSTWAPTARGSCPARDARP